MLRCTIPPGATGVGIRLPLLAGLLMIGLSVAVQAQTRVYRCTSEAGGTEFRQTACAPGAAEEELRIEDRNTGWVPPRPTDEPAPNDDGKGGERRRQESKRASDGKRDERCWKKRRQLEEVNWRLRRGYKPSAGAKLRRRRDDYEAYIDRFCDGLGR